MIRSFNLYVCTLALLSSAASMCMHQRKNATPSSTSLSAPASSSSPYDYDQMSLVDLGARRGEWNNYSLWLESFGCPGNATIGGQVACAIGAMCLNLIHYEQRQSVTQAEKEELKKLTDAIEKNPEFQRENWKKFKKEKMQELCLARIAGD